MNLKFSIRKIPPLELDKPATIDINKTILYGPNGVGKSNIIKTLFSLTSPDPLWMLSRYFENDYKKIDVILSYLDKAIGVKDGKIEGIHTIFNINASLVEDDIAYVGTHLFSRERIDIRENFEKIIENEAFIWNIQDFLLDIEVPPSNIEKQKFSHGIKRALLILYALENSDAVFIEGFENGMHIDLIRKLFEYIDDIYGGKIIVVETHNILLLKLGVLKGWSVYYISRNLIKKLSEIEDLRDTTLFNKEIEAITI